MSIKLLIASVLLSQAYGSNMPFQAAGLGDSGKSFTEMSQCLAAATDKNKDLIAEAEAPEKAKRERYRVIREAYMAEKKIASVDKLRALDWKVIYAKRDEAENAITTSTGPAAVRIAVCFDTGILK